MRLSCCSAPPARLHYSSASGRSRRPVRTPQGRTRMSGQTNRRQFLQAGAAAGIGFWTAGGVSAEDKKERSSVERLKIACIGVGGKGSSDTDHAGMVGDVVALCDIDDNPLNKKAEK